MAANFALPDRLRLLCVEDNPDDFELIGIALQRADPGRLYERRRVDNAEDFGAALAQPCDVILCDFNLPRFSPYAALELLASAGSPLPLVIVTRAIGEEAAVALMRAGAKDYVTKDKLRTLPQVIARVLAERQRAEERDRLAWELQQAYARLKQLSARAIRAQERERSLLSRELHDELGQSLTAMVLRLHAADQAWGTPAAREHQAVASDTAQAALQKLKTLSFALRPAQLDHLGLEAAVRSALERMAQPAGVRYGVRRRGEEPRPLRENAAAIARLAQEAVTNSVRHAHGSLVLVRLRFLPDGRIGLLVIDDGDGFEKAEVLGDGPSERNVGLYGMMERTELAGGRLQIRAQPGRGVAVRAVL
jgi:signal transduction histidine kinase